MLLFIKGIIIGIGKIIPGVSGALLAINFHVYEKLINAITNFFASWKDNLKFLIIILSGIFLSIIIGSKLILYLFTHYKFLTMMLFIGLIIGGVYNFKKRVFLDRNKTIVVILIIIIFSTIYLLGVNNTYVLKNNFVDNIMFILGGIIEVISSIIPGISSTSLLMIIGLYDHILALISHLLNINYVWLNLGHYVSYFIGMLLSLIISAYFISYLLKKHKEKFNILILGLSISSIICLIVITFKLSFSAIELILGIMLLTVGLLVSSILDK